MGRRRDLYWEGVRLSEMWSEASMRLLPQQRHTMAPEHLRPRKRADEQPCYVKPRAKRGNADPGFTVSRSLPSLQKDILNKG